MKQIYNETAKQRIKQFLQKEGIKQAWFERKIGLKLGDCTGTVNSDTLRKVLELYPQINMRWLIFGEGDMYETPTEDTTATILELRQENQNLKEKMDRIKEISNF